MAQHNSDNYHKSTEYKYLVCKQQNWIQKLNLKHFLFKETKVGINNEREVKEEKVYVTTSWGSYQEIFDCDILH